MKISFLLSNYGPGGAERTVSYLADYFAENNYEVDILVLNNNIFYSNLNKVNIRFFFVKKYFKKNKPDRVFCMLYHTIIYTYGLKRKYGFKLIGSERNNPQLNLSFINKFIKALFDIDKTFLYINNECFV